jgi:hypothetical protein
MTELCPLVNQGIDTKPLHFEDVHSVPASCLKCARVALSGYNDAATVEGIEQDEDDCLDFLSTDIIPTYAYSFSKLRNSQYQANVRHGTAYMDGDICRGWKLDLMVTTDFECELTHKSERLRLF